jgi:RNA polymerase sigma-70 factor (ECF subfamily)
MKSRGSTRARIESRLVAQLFEEHREWLYRTILARTGDPEGARDLVQETFLRAHRAALRFNLASMPHPYLRRIALNLIPGFRRNRQAVTPSEHMDSTVDPESLRGFDTLHRTVSLVLEGLPEEQRRVAEMRLYEACDFTEVAGRLGISIRTAKRRMAAARAGIKKRLAP